MKRKIFTPLVFILLTALYTKAQDNNIKVNVINLFSKKLAFSYERAINKHQSLQLDLGFQLKKTIPTYIDSDDETESAVGSYNGYSIMPEYRFYSKSKRNALTGFYFAPYLKYYHYGIKMDVDFDHVRYDVDGKWNSIGGGCLIGWQWIIKERFSIDFNLIGLGIQNHSLNFDYTTNDPYFDYAANAEDIKTEVGDYPIVGKHLSVTSSKKSINAKTNFIFLGMQGAFRLGFAF
jgi:hypothetical protein